MTGEVDQRIERGIRRLIARAVFVNDTVARRLGLRLVDLEVLNLMALPGGPVSPSAVTAATGLPSTTTTRVLDRLQQAGFLRREPDPGDRRRTVLVLDRDRLAEFETMYEALRAANRARGERFTAAELDVVARYLDEHVADDRGVRAIIAADAKERSRQAD